MKEIIRREMGSTSIPNLMRFGVSVEINKICELMHQELDRKENEKKEKDKHKA